MIIDITRELFSVEPFPGDPIPERIQFRGFNKPEPDIYQLTIVKLSGHAGTHIDAPLHFLPNGKDAASVDVSRGIGDCKVVSHSGDVTAEDAEKMLSDNTERLLIKGKITITPEAAEVMAARGLLALGTEEMTVGKDPFIAAVHRTLLGAEVLIIENLDLSQAEDGEYFLSALPLKMSELDGSPVRAVLISK